jgi:non-lysosomal glucosylceramidase
MSKWHVFSKYFLLVFIFCLSNLVFAGDDIPAAAWRRPIGAPLANPGGRKPNLTIIDDGYWQGAPVGGFGAGTFSRTYRGNFERWHVKAGIHKYQDVPANQFAVFAQTEGEAPIAQVLSTQKPQGNDLSAWNWSYPVGAGEYAALYPKSWFAYKSKQLPVALTLEQYSPIIPDNYKESSYPVAVYNWYVSNPSQKRVTVSILFSWTNMLGWFRDSTTNFAAGLNAQNINHYKSEALKNGEMQGIVFDRLRSNPVSEEWDGQMAIAALAGKDAQVSYLTTYRPSDSGADVWKPFAKDGTLPDQNAELASSGDVLAGAIAVKFTLAPGEKRMVPMSLSWDLPYIEFGSGRKWVRHYTRFFDRSGTNAWKIARVALEQGQEWGHQIDAWQKPFIENNSEPEWYRGMLFNELYDLADGGTVWAHEVSAPGNLQHPSAAKEDTFSYLECFDYPYYGTLDVLFYGSFPLAKFWPELDKQQMREYADTIPETIKQNYVWAWKSDKDHTLVQTQRKVSGSAPHDLGSPTEDAFVLPNQYNFQSVSDWKDLNSKYVLMVWRDYVMSGSKDKAFLQYNFSAVKQAMQFLRQFDKDNDGLIENDGYPDQTYDTWSARGESAYSGSLYLGALRATEEMAKVVGDARTATENGDLFKRAQASFIKKLWNGKYFNYDVGSSYKDSIMADQLAGQWYASLTGLGDLVPPEMQRSAMKHVYDFNVMKLKNGTMGALNGIGANGDLLKDDEQTEEVWVGVTFGAASTMLNSGLHDEAFATAKGIYKVVYEDKGYWFRTPEAWDATGFYRAGMYMRPGAIWSMEMKPIAAASATATTAAAK